MAVNNPPKLRSNRDSGPGVAEARLEVGDRQPSVPDCLGPVSCHVSVGSKGWVGLALFGTVSKHQGDFKLLPSQAVRGAAALLTARLWCSRTEGATPSVWYPCINAALTPVRTILC